jgi:PAS domain S-box-containing protein
MNELNAALLHIIEQAIETTTEGITISDARLPNNPLIYANPAFYEVTGYTPEETLGYNCRFLQGAGTDPNAVQAIREAIASGGSSVVELLNYQKDGTPFWNRLSIVPIYDANGILTNFVGIQSDQTVVKEAERAKAQLAAMRATMQTVNDVVRNFMSNVDYFQMQFEDTNGANAEISAEYEEAKGSVLATLTMLSAATEYHDRELLRGIVGIDLAAIAPTPNSRIE